MRKHLNKFKNSISKLETKLLNKPHYVVYPVVLASLISLFMPDKLIKHAMNKFNGNTHYEMYIRKHGRQKVIEVGKLGKFYQCLTGYKKIAHKRPNTSSGYDPTTIYLKLPNNFELRGGVNSNEVYYFHFVQFGDSSKESSKTYAVNCSLSLLNNTKRFG